MDSPSLPPRVVWHTVESPTGDAYFRSMADYLLREGVWPHLIYDPETDRLGQFAALDTSARALKNDGSTRTNRTGRVCIQIEVLGRAASPFTEQSTWRPGPNFAALMAAIRSWNIPDAFPMGPPPAYPGGSRRDRNIWLNQAGHYCHANIPGNDHGDPGAINPAKLWAAGGSSTPSDPDSGPPIARYQRIINGLAYGYGAYGDHVTAVGVELCARDFGEHYSDGPGPRWTDADTLNYAEFQKGLGYTGRDADGVPGEASLRALLGYLPGSGGELEPFPGAGFFRPGRRSNVITEMGRRLIAEGCGRYRSGPGPEWTEADRQSYAAFQRKLGYSGAAADGYPGAASWAALQVPRT